MAWFSPGNSSTSCAGRTPVLCSRASAISAPWCLCSSRPAWAHFESAEGCHSRAAAARGALPLMIGFERQEWEALSADERGGGRGLVVVVGGWVLLVSRRTLQDAYARGAVYSMSRAVQHACAASIFHTSLCKLQHMRLYKRYVESVWVPPRALCFTILWLRLSRNFNIQQKGRRASRLPLAVHVTSPDHLHAWNCVRQPRDAMAHWSVDHATTCKCI